MKTRTRKLRAGRGRRLKGIGMIAASLAALGSAARGEVLYESGEMGAPGQATGTVVHSSAFLGARFQVFETVTADRIGGHLGSVFTPSGTLFGALVQLSGPSDFPDTNDLSSADVLRTTVLSAPYGTNEVVEKFTPISLSAGWYAVIFGSGKFGATGTGVAAMNNPVYGEPSYISRYDNNNWTNNGSSGFRFIVAGPSHRFWADPISGDWHNPSNWYTPSVPQSYDDVTFDLFSTFAINFGQNAIVHDLKNQFSNVTLALGGKTLTSTGQVVVGSDPIGGAVLNLQNGTLSMPGHDIVVGETGVASMTVSNFAHVSGYAATSVVIGQRNAGQLTVANNGQVYCAVARVADDQSTWEGEIRGSGTVSLSNAGMINVRDSFYAGRNGPAVVNIGVGGDMYVGNTVKIFDSAGTQFSLQGGWLRTGSLDTSGNPSRFHWTSGTLQTTNPLTIQLWGPLGESPTIGAGQTWRCDGAAHVAAGADLNVTGGAVIGPVTNDGTITQTGGSMQVTGSNGLTGFGVTNVSGGTLAARRIRQQAITIDGGVVALHVSGATGPSTSLIGFLNISASGKLDLSDKKLIVAAGGTSMGSWDGSAYTGVLGMVQSGRGDGSWNGESGIITSQSSATSGVLTGIAVASAAEALGLSGGDSVVWGGEWISAGSTLVMYTWGGDAELDGDLDGDDYFWIDSNVGNSGSVFGYHQGDFDYDGDIDGDDYFIIDSNIAFAQSQPPFPTSSGGPASAGSHSVPEPAGVGMIAVGALALRRRRILTFAQ